MAILVQQYSWHSVTYCTNIQNQKKSCTFPFRWGKKPELFFYHLPDPGPQNMINSIHFWWSPKFKEALLTLIQWNPFFKTRPWKFSQCLIFLILAFLKQGLRHKWPFQICSGTVIHKHTFKKTLIFY